MIPRWHRRSAALLLLLLRSGSSAHAAEVGTSSPAPAPEAVIADVPFEPYPEPNRIVVNLAPEGHKPFPLMLDTGAAESVLTPRAARSLGISVRRAKSSRYRRPTRLGRDLQFWINTRRGDTASNVAFEYGLLGSDFLDDYVLEIDFPARRVRFLDPDRYQLPEEVTHPDEGLLPIRRVGTRIAAAIEVNGRSGLALLDTGAPGTLVLSGKLARELGVDVDPREPAGQVQSTAGPVSVRSATVESLRIAGFELGRTPVRVAPAGLYNIGGSTDSLVGYDVLSRFVLRIDFEGRRIWLARPDRDRGTSHGSESQP